jgi:hypothetical protein
MVTTYYDISVQEANTTSLFVSKHSNESDYIIYVHLDTTDSQHSHNTISCWGEQVTAINY